MANIETEVKNLAEEVRGAISQLKDTRQERSAGVVTRIGDGVAWIYGLRDCGYAEMIEIEGLQILAEKLGVTIDYLWSVLLKQAYISAALELLFVLLVVVMWMALIKSREVIKKRLKTIDDVGGGFTLFIGSVFTIGVTVAAISFIFTSASALINPEYWALKEILSAVGRR